MGRGLIEPWHILLLVVVVALLFGWKKLPDISRSVGRSMRIFKSEVKEMGHDDEKPAPSQPAPREVEGRIVEPTPDAPRATTPGERTDRDR